MPRKNEGTVKELKRKSGAKVIVARFRYLDESGKQRERSKVVENKTLGWEWIEEQQAELKTSGKKAFSSEKTFQEFSEWYKDLYIKDVERDPATNQILSGRKSVKPVLSQLKFLQDFFGKMPLKKIDYHSLERYKAHRLKPYTTESGASKQRKPATVKREISLMSSIMKKAVQQKLITKSPFTEGDPLIKGGEVERTRVLTKAEQDALLAACFTVKGGKDRKHLKPLILFAVNTGLRRGEILKLTWRFIDLDLPAIILPSEITKTEMPRVVPILEELLPILEEMRVLAKSDDEKIFPAIGDFKTAWATAKKIAGIENLRFHDLRASFATRMIIDKGLASDLVRKVTGHKTSRVFDRYFRPGAEDLVRQFRGE